MSVVPREPTVRRRRWPLAAALVLGLGLAAAPFAFEMFERAPEGADMIDAFRPYMSAERIDELEGYLGVIDAARAETVAADLRERPPALTTFEQQWPSIDADMSEMLGTMDDNIDEFGGISALPDFSLFPWFFVVPGALVACVAVAGLARASDRRAQRARVAVVVLGVGLLAAPVVFQMFTRAPGGGRMIEDFREFMSTEKLRTIQGYFLVIGTGEGALRTQLLPTLDAAAFPATTSFVDAWPMISSEFAEMIGTMSDNVDNYAAVDALPPFPFFPWFFVLPGAMLLGLGTMGNVSDGSRRESRSLEAV